MNPLHVHSLSTQSVSITKPNSQSVHQSGQNQSFQQHFQTAIELTNHKVIVSKHAQVRMNQRNIEIDAGTWSKIDGKIQQAKKLGITDALVLTEQAALVVSAKNHTVITAMDRKEASTQIFTNINGTILID